jgi:hypothetical protein
MSMIVQIEELKFGVIRMTWITVKQRTQRNQIAGGITARNKTPHDSANQAITRLCTVASAEWCCLAGGGLSPCLAPPP